MRISLVPNVKDESVLRAVEDVVHGDCELYNPKARAQVASCLGDHVDQLGADLFGQGLELLCVEVLQVHRVVDGVQEGGGRAVVLVPAVEILLR